MKKITIGLVASTFFFNSGALWACSQCRPFVKSGIYNQDFAGNLFVMLLPIVILLAVGFGIYFADALTAKLRKGAKAWQTTYNAAR